MKSCQGRAQILGLLVALPAALGFLVACSDVGFQTVPSKTCVDFNEGGDQSCRVNPEGNTYTVKFTTGQVDLLFLNDNSRSMSPEQSRMADAISGIINNIANLDYRIAMITTDLAKEDGRLLEFTDEAGRRSGEKFLVKTSTNLLSKFRGTVQRKETVNCDNNTTPCPSDDERGIYSVNRAMERNEGGWIRSGAHLAVIALADEDQRSGTYFDTDLGKWEAVNAKFGYALEDKDRPETLVTDFSRRYPGKIMSFHSVIVPPGDSYCLNQQTVYLPGNPFPLRGSYGNLYDILSRAAGNGLDRLGQIVDGSVASICNSTYYNDLNVMGSMIAANANRYSVQMQCLPKTEDIKVTASQAVDYSVDQASKKILFSNLPFGVEITVSWVCPNSV
jgi:hypothetical protein